MPTDDIAAAIAAIAAGSLVFAEATVSFAIPTDALAVLTAFFATTTDVIAAVTAAIAAGSLVFAEATVSFAMQTDAFVLGEDVKVRGKMAFVCTPSFFIPPFFCFCKRKKQTCLPTGKEKQPENDALIHKAINTPPFSVLGFFRKIA